MAHHHHEHETEKKPVAFTVPLIFGLFTIFVILLFVSLGDPKHGCCDGKEDCCKAEASMKGAHGEKDSHEHGEAGKEESSHHH